MIKSCFFVIFSLLFISAQCANVLTVTCENGPFDVAEEEQHLNCTIFANSDSSITEIFGYAYVPLNEARNPNPNYVPTVLNCDHFYSTPVHSVVIDCEVHLPRFAADGVYTFSAFATLADEDSLFNSSFFEVEQEINDRVPPHVVAITAPATYNTHFLTSDWVVLELEDDASGISMVYYSIHSSMDGGDELFRGTWKFEAEEEHDHDHEHGEEEEHNHEEEEHNEEEHSHGEEDSHEDDDHDHDHEHEESAPTHLHVTVPLTLRERSEELPPGTYYLSVDIWDSFWSVRYTTYELKNNGFTWNVTLLPPSNCTAGKYGDNINKPNKCKKCPIGSYSGEGATKCAACPPGSIPNHHQDGCDQCPLGTYEFTGIICVPCSHGSSGPLGAHSVRQCEKI